MIGSLLDIIREIIYIEDHFVSQSVLAVYFSDEIGVIGTLLDTVREIISIKDHCVYIPKHS